MVFNRIVVVLSTIEVLKGLLITTALIERLGKVNITMFIG